MNKKNSNLIEVGDRIIRSNSSQCHIKTSLTRQVKSNGKFKFSCGMKGVQFCILSLNIWFNLVSSWAFQWFICLQLNRHSDVHKLLEVKESNFLCQRVELLQLRYRSIALLTLGFGSFLDIYSSGLEKLIEANNAKFTTHSIRPLLNFPSWTHFPNVSKTIWTFNVQQQTQYNSQTFLRIF